jgi:hypothetical protein
MLKILDKSRKEIVVKLSDIKEIVDNIKKGLPTQKAGSLVVFGDVFGGRIDNIHTVTSAHVGNGLGHLIVEFDLGEKLEVWNPEDVLLGPEHFQILRASRVRWEWGYYGRPETSDNRMFIEHSIAGERVEVTTNRTSPPKFAPSIDRPAVELISMDEQISGAWSY